jgi:hypothetical protein
MSEAPRGRAKVTALAVAAAVTVVKVAALAMLQPWWVLQS